MDKADLAIQEAMNRTLKHITVPEIFKIKTMKTEFIPYDQALQLKELGFTEQCFGAYYTANKSFTTHDFIKQISDDSALFEPNYIVNSSDDYYVSAPLYQQAFRWLTTKTTNPLYVEDFLVAHLNEYDNREQAELACLKKLIEIVKAKLNKA